MPGLRVAVLMLFAFCGVSRAQQDLTLVYRIRASEHGEKSLQDGAKLTVYIQGKKLRTEYEFATPMGLTESTLIHRCDLGRVWTLAPTVHRPSYLERVVPLGAESQRLPFHLLQPATAGEAVNYHADITWEATGETKQAFGFTARHYRRVVEESGSEALKIGAKKTTESVWYLEIPSITPCYSPAPQPEFRAQPSRFDRERMRIAVQQHGDPPQGIELSNEQKSSSTIPWRDPSSYPADVPAVFVIELVDLKQSPLDPRLFEIPPGFTLYQSRKNASLLRR